MLQTTSPTFQYLNTGLGLYGVDKMLTPSSVMLTHADEAEAMFMITFVECYQSHLNIPEDSVRSKSLGYPCRDVMLLVKENRMDKNRHKKLAFAFGLFAAILKLFSMDLLEFQSRDCYTTFFHGKFATKSYFILHAIYKKKYLDFP